MLKNYILIAFRSLRKHLSYSVINIVGLGLGLATCLLLITWILHELSYDRFNEKANRIYRSSLEYGFGGQVARVSVSPTALLPALLNLPETETGVRVYNPSGFQPYIVKKDDKFFQERKFYVADSTFFDVFSYRLLKGNAHDALTKPYQVVLTQAMATKYFGEEDPLGKTLFVNGSQDYVVTGVMENVPSNSMLQFDFVASFMSLRAAREQPIWWSANYQTFVVIHPNADVKALEEKTNEVVKKAVANELSGPGDYVRYNFTPLTDIYLKSDFNGEPEIVSDIKYIYIFAAVAFLILLIACINYINLATARATDRAKEVGIRKVVGAVRKQLFAQFIGESIIVTIFSFALAFLLSQLMLPFFNQLTGKRFTAGILLQPSFLIGSLIALLVIAVLSGAYPAFAITNFKPVTVLKGNFKSSGKGIWLRKALVVFQFSISVILIVGTLIIVKQLDFIQGKNLGYDRENTIVLPLDNQTSKVFETLKNELVRNNLATHVGRATESPINVQGGYSINRTESNDPGIITTGLLVDEEYLPAIGIEPMLGRSFTKEDVERVNRDTVYTFILNEAALAAMAIEKDQAIGKKVRMGDRAGEIIGVVKDFHFASLHRNIGPLVIFPEEQQFSKIFVKLPAGDVANNLEKIQKVYSAVITHRPFEYQFLDQQYEALYVNEQRLGSVFIVFATLAIIIACLGLLGLVSFSAAQKTKEIGIRKVLGATASNIVVLITRDFTSLVLISIAIGLPVAYWIMSQWLGAFAYKTEIGIVPLIAASIICIIIALGTAGYQAIKAAFIDPAKTLRNE
jgi:putative ABC transport system permease protein